MVDETSERVNPTGFYYNRGAKKLVELTDPIMIGAFVQAGFESVSYEEAQEVLKASEAEVAPETPVVAQPTNKELAAELIALGADPKEVKKLKNKDQLQEALALYKANN
ncbi:MAG: hypothetical protein Q8910_01615 [Bacteroidota bacterium]|nr:hypothetical protein [Bacteroidota bacterium]